jgi:hypothetical protein
VTKLGRFQNLTQIRPISMNFIGCDNPFMVVR